MQLVVPCFNEATRLTVRPWLQFVAANPDVTLVFVNDGSTDATADVLRELASGGGARISVLTLAANGGKARAVQHGIMAALVADPDVVGYWDADLSTPLDECHALLDVLERQPQVDIVMGSRIQLLGRRIERRAVRHYSGRVFATAASLTLGIPVYDTQCGAKLFRVTSRVREIFATPFTSPWVMDVELLARYLAFTGRAEAGIRICEVPLHTWIDVPGSKLSVGASLRALWALAGIWWRHRT